VMIVSQNWRYFYVGSYWNCCGNYNGLVYSFARDINNPNYLAPLSKPLVTLYVPITAVVIDIADTKMFVLTLQDIRVFTRDVNSGLLSTAPAFVVRYTQPAGVYYNNMALSFEDQGRNLYACGANGEVITFASDRLSGNLTTNPYGNPLILSQRCVNLLISSDNNNVYVATHDGFVRQFSRFVPCQAGQYIGQDQTCYPCGENSFSPSPNSTLCTLCPPNQYKPSPDLALNNSDFEFDIVSARGLGAYPRSKVLWSYTNIFLL
jgi:hypothetical protein